MISDKHWAHIMGCKSESYVFFIFNDEIEGDGDGEDDGLYRKNGNEKDSDGRRSIQK